MRVFRFICFYFLRSAAKVVADSSTEVAAADAVLTEHQKEVNEQRLLQMQF